MANTLRQGMESALLEAITKVVPNLRPGVIPEGVRDESLYLEETLDLPEGSDLMVEIERRGFRAIFLENLTYIAYQRLGAICVGHEAGPVRQEALCQELATCLEGSFELFWGALEAIIRRPLPLLPGKPLDYLAMNEDLALAFIQTFKSSKDPNNLRQKIAERCAAHKRSPIHNFRGASIPNPVPLFDDFGRLCKEINGSHAANIFGNLMRALYELGEEATGGQQEVFFTPGARKGWLSIFEVLRKNYPGLRVYGTSHEYLAMLQDRNVCRMVDGGNTKEETESGELKISERILAAIYGEADLVKQPVVFLSSVRRTGERVDVNRVMKEIRTAVPTVIFVVDAAQDHYMYPDADVVIYSKRFGGTGTGLVMLNKAFPERIKEAMATQEGVNVQLLGATVAGLRCERQQTHFANRLEDLTTTPELWEFKGGGTHIDRQAAKIAGIVADHPVLSEYFLVHYETEHPNKDNPNLWKSSRIITLTKKPHSNLDLVELAETVERTTGIHLDWISPSSEPEFREIMELAVADYSRGTCRKLCDAILNFQTNTKPTYFTEMIALPEVFNGTAPMDRDTFERQIAYLLASINRQSMVRLYIDIQMNKDDIENMLSALTSAVSTLTASD